jgi:hypothetical protein
VANWDRRLITPQRHYELVAEWPYYTSYELAELSQFEPEGGGGGQADRVQLNLRCGRCDQSMGLLPSLPGERSNVGELAAGVLRHMVMAHDVALSGLGKGAGT